MDSNRNQTNNTSQSKKETRKEFFDLLKKDRSQVLFLVNMIDYLGMILLGIMVTVFFLMLKVIVSGWDNRMSFQEMLPFVIITSVVLFQLFRYLRANHFERNRELRLPLKIYCKPCNTKTWHNNLSSEENGHYVCMSCLAKLEIDKLK